MLYLCWIAASIRVDGRVRIKCIIPKCGAYGSCAHCPPHTLGPEEIRDIVRQFHHALLVKVEVPSAIVAGDSGVEIDEKGNTVPNENMRALFKGYRDVFDSVTSIESRAFYDGYYLATGFGVGSCHAVYCNFKGCQVLQNLPCRFPLRARPSMKASSMDVFRMASEAGWDIYPIGTDCRPEDVPHGTLVGMVLIE